jgi:hypothetical protein
MTKMRERLISVVARYGVSAIALLSLVRPTAAQDYHPPLEAYVDMSAVPRDLLVSAEPDDPTTPVDESNILDRIRVKGFRYAEIQNAAGVDIGARITGKLIFNPGFRLGLSALDALELVVAEGEFEFEMVAREEVSALPEENYPFIFAIKAIPLRLRLKTDLLRPVKKAADGQFSEYQQNSAGEYVDDVGNPVYADLVNTVTVVIRYTWDGEPEVAFSDPATGAIPQFSISSPVMIGETGVVLEVTDAQVDLSATASPAGIADPAWMGVRFGQFAVHFTNGLEVPEMRAGPGATPTRPEMASIQLTNFSVGNGGFSGRISGSTTGLIEIPLFGMVFELDSIGLEFSQNALVSSSITGTIREFPYFQTDVKLSLALDLKGNFKIGIAADDPNRNGAGLVSWTIASVFTLEVESISFEYREQVFLTRLNGAIIPLFFDADIDASDDSDPRIEINGLTITSTGEVSLEGGWITLPSKRYLDFHAFKIELAQIGFGTDEGTAASRSWVGFTGGIELVEGLSASAKVKKLQFLWPRKDGTPGVDVKLEGIEVAYSQPGVVTFKGSVDWFEEANRKGFAGAIDLNLEFIKTSVNGRLVIGETVPSVGAPATQVGSCTTTPTTSPFKFFYIDLEANLPAGIPVFSNVSIYGFLGLFAYNMEPHICAFAKPLDWFRAHMAATNVVGGSPPPWIPADDAVAVGLGVILGTTSDDGYVIHTKVALTVAVPGPVVILSGAGNILKERGELTTGGDPLFLALAVFDGRQKVFLINLGIHYRIPSGGEVIDLTAEAEAYFNLSDPSDWHLWLGKKTPESERIRAQVLKFLTASAYYMLDPNQLGFGAKAGYDSRPGWKFGPLRVVLAAWFSYDVEISWRPVHAWGNAQLAGAVELSAFGFGVGLSAHASLTLATPTPYLIDGRFRVKLKLPWPLPDPSATVHLRWEEEKPKLPLDQLVTQVGLEASKSMAAVTAAPQRGVTVSSGHSVDLSTLCSPWESLPAMPELDEDLNGNGVLDPGEDFNGDGVLNVSTPTPSCTDRPMVPVNYRPVVAFGRSTNESLSGADQPTLTGNTGTYVDVIGEATFRYNLTSLKLWASKKTGGASVTFSDVLPEVYGAWPALLGDPQQPGALYVKLWSKNPFDIYEPSTYLFHDGGRGSWTDWFAETYGDWPCPAPTKGTQVGIQANLLPFLAIQTAVTRGRQGPIQVPPLRPDSVCADPGILTQEDLILPPYHVFALAVESEVATTGPAAGKTYRDVAYFHTEGAPLNLDPYVYLTVPAALTKLHYRSYDVGLRFNETYMDLLYKEPGSPAELLYKNPTQKFVLEVLDENGEPLRDPADNFVPITTRWELAPDHIRNRTDEEWLELLQDRGVPVDVGLLPKDDMVYGRPNWAGGFRSRTRYVVRAWLEDDRLLTDTRLDDDIWLAANAVREHEGNRVLLFDYPLVTSAYDSFAELAASYEGQWWPLEVAAFSPAIVNPAAANAVSRTVAVTASVGNGDAGVIARYLAQAATPLGPDDLGPGDLEAWIARVPGYTALPNELSDAQRDAILAAWEDEIDAYDRLSEHMALEREQEPLPLQAEVNVLMLAGSARGFLLELPEPVEWARVRLSMEGPTGVRTPAVIVNHQGTRAFILDATGGSVAALGDGVYRLTLEFHRDIGSRNPRYYAPDGLVTETATLEAVLPDGHFTPESP